MFVVDDTRTKAMAAPRLVLVSGQGSPDDVTNDINTGHCSKTTVDKLAAQLESGITRDAVDDVRAAIAQGAPVNFVYKVRT